MFALTYAVRRPVYRNFDLGNVIVHKTHGAAVDKIGGQELLSAFFIVAFHMGKSGS
jgi:hypothetical protein